MNNKITLITFTLLLNIIINKKSYITNTCDRFKYILKILLSINHFNLKFLIKLYQKSKNIKGNEFFFLQC